MNINKNNGKSVPCVDIFSAVELKTKDELAVELGLKDADLINFGLNDTGNSRRFLSIFGKDYKFVVDTGKWIKWNGLIWEVDNTNGIVAFQEMLELFEKQVDTIQNMDSKVRSEHKKFISASYNMAKIQAALSLVSIYPSISVGAANLDQNQYLFATNNSIIDLKTGSETTPSRDQLITKFSEVEYNKNSTCPTWLKFLDTVTGGNADLQRYLQDISGYTCTGSTSEQSVFFIYGHGRNGKSVFTNTLQKLLGQYAGSSGNSLISLNKNSTSSNDLADLCGTRLALVSELPEQMHLDEARLKLLASSDKITARFLYKDFFSFTPTQKVVICTNHKPVINGADLGIWRRVKLVPFSVTIPEADVDYDLQSKLDKELPGILNWAIDGCVNWQKNGIKAPKVVIEATNDYKEESDTLGQFIEEEFTLCTQDDGMMFGAVYEIYVRWAAQNNLRYPLTKISLSKRLFERPGFSKKCKMSGVWIMGLLAK